MDWVFTLTAAAYNLVGLPKLMALELLGTETEEFPTALNFRTFRYRRYPRIASHFPSSATSATRRSTQLSE